MQTNYLSIIPVILNPKFRRVLELWTKMCKRRDRPYAVYTASGEVQPNDVTVELSCYARQALYAGIGLSSIFYVTLWYVSCL